jgi:exopolysaccharide production protein ExoY
MATRIDEMAQSATRQAQAFTGHFGEALPPNHTASLFDFVRDEPFVEASQEIALATPTAGALALQRCLDLTLATLCLLVLWPLMLAVGVLVWLTSPGPVFYSQPRLGRNGAVFGCLKFRTMMTGADRLLQELLESSPALQEVWTRDRKLRDDPRITPLGRILRRYSIDELPQLFNVLRGDMSMVGPRPLATDEAHFYAEAFGTYCLLKPGITGPWQVGGRNHISFEGRARLDCEYARTKSYRQDFRLILQTIPVVLRGTGF